MLRMLARCLRTHRQNILIVDSMQQLGRPFRGLNCSVALAEDQAQGTLTTHAYYGDLVLLYQTPNMDGWVGGWLYNMILGTSTVQQVLLGPNLF